jgi:hypothetical protein
MRTFWLVWKDNGGIPTVPHDSLDSAKREAERLARMHPGSKFYVLQTVGACSKTDVLWDEDHEPPF